MGTRVQHHTAPGPTKTLLPLGDFHLGHEDCMHDKLAEAIQWVSDTDGWILGMGDWIECALKGSPGKSLYNQVLTPQQQIEQVIELLKPVGSNIVGLIDGNHENRVTIQTGTKPMWTIGQALKAPYIGVGGALRLVVGKQGYTVYAKHGATGSATIAGKINAVQKLQTIFPCADLYLMGHVHQYLDIPGEYLYYNGRMKSVEHRDTQFCLTGHFLKFDGGYGDESNYSPGVAGYPKITLYGEERKIEIEKG